MNARAEKLGLSHRRAIIVGAGQAGLAVSAELVLRGLVPQRDFVVIDRAPRIRSWASRWHSLRLLSEARHSALPPFPFPGDPRRHPRVDEMASYLAAFEKHIGLIPRWGVQAIDVTRVGNSTTLELRTDAGDVQTRNVVCATGAHARPHVPAWSSDLTVPGTVLHSSQYQYPRQIPVGDVLIVGGGNAGVQLARELLANHRVTLATRTPRRRRPAAAYPAMSGDRQRRFTGERVPEPLFTDSYAALREAGVDIAPAAVGAIGAEVVLSDGRQLCPTSVVFATGYRPGDDWLPDDVRPHPRKRGRTSMPGLFTAGLPRYGCPGGDTIQGVLRDAARVARHIIQRP
ncbi:NAD(P)/FAD-dependent oxidoreductase [Microbacterium rhizophilus]|uniref:NAD(P)/FAD-dependent oxidoreductase n=1 Tax=Microbacterium rhizophilus TaxID=3138934 RepID=UPI0031ED0F48